MSKLQPRSEKNRSERFYARLALPIAFGLTVANEVDIWWAMVWGVVVWLIMLYLDKGRSLERTSAAAILVRMYMFGLLLVGGMQWMVSERTRHNWDWENLFIQSSIFVFMFFAIMLPAIQTMFYFMDSIASRWNPILRWSFANGDHPLWDNAMMPRLFNPDNFLVRQNGLGEPVYHDFVPPLDWLCQCPACGARVNGIMGAGTYTQMVSGPCWNCGNGENGSTIAFAERWGSAYRAATGRPYFPETGYEKGPPEEWNFTMPMRRKD